MQNPPLNYWHVSNSLTPCCFLKEKYPPKPIKVYISFGSDNISRPLFQWQIKSFVQWTLTWVLIPLSLFSVCPFAHFATNVDDSIQIPWCIRKHLSQVGLLLLTSLQPVPFKTSFHMLPDKPGQILLWLWSSLDWGQLEDGESQGKVRSECICPSRDWNHVCKSQSLLISSWKN